MGMEVEWSEKEAESRNGEEKCQARSIILYTFDAARTHLLANNGGRMVIGVRGFRLRQEEEREWGNECVDDGEWIGRGRERDAEQ